MVAIFKDYFNYDSTAANYISNLLLIDSSIAETKLLELANTEETVFLLINDYIVKPTIYDKITEIGVPTVVLINEKDLELFSEKITSKVIDIRTKSNEGAVEEIGVV